MPSLIRKTLQYRPKSYYTLPHIRIVNLDWLPQINGKWSFNWAPWTNVSRFRNTNTQTKRRSLKSVHYNCPINWTAVSSICVLYFNNNQNHFLYYRIKSFNSFLFLQFLQSLNFNPQPALNWSSSGVIRLSARWFIQFQTWEPYKTWTWQNLCEPQKLPQSKQSIILTDKH